MFTPRRLMKRNTAQERRRRRFQSDVAGRGMSGLLSSLAGIVSVTSEGLIPLCQTALLSRGWNLYSVQYIILAHLCGSSGTAVVMGDCIDKTRHKRLWLWFCALLVGGLGMALSEMKLDLQTALIISSLQGIASNGVRLSITAITLGVRSKSLFDGQVCYNEASAATVLALCIVLTAVFSSFCDAGRAPFWVILGTAVVSTPLVFAIPHDAIDDEHARCMEDDSPFQSHRHDSSKQESARCSLLCGGKMMVLVLPLTSFYLASSGISTAVSSVMTERLQAVSGGDVQKNAEVLAVASTMLATVLVMIGTCLLLRAAVGWYGRRPLLVTGLMTMPFHGALTAFLSDSEQSLVITGQVFEGIGRATLKVVTQVMVRDITEYTGRFNMSMGMALMCERLGSAIAFYTSDQLLSSFGYPAAFWAYACVGLLPVALCGWCLSETLPVEERKLLKLGHGGSRLSSSSSYNTEADESNRSPRSARYTPRNCKDGRSGNLAMWRSHFETEEWAT